MSVPNTAANFSSRTFTIYPRFAHGSQAVSSDRSSGRQWAKNDLVAHGGVGKSSRPSFGDDRVWKPIGPLVSSVILILKKRRDDEGRRHHPG
jgi:hypothetical protein